MTLFLILRKFKIRNEDSNHGLRSSQTQFNFIPCKNCASFMRNTQFTTAVFHRDVSIVLYSNTTAAYKTNNSILDYYVVFCMRICIQMLQIKLLCVPCFDTLFI